MTLCAFYLLITMHALGWHGREKEREREREREREIVDNYRNQCTGRSLRRQITTAR